MKNSEIHNGLENQLIRDFLAMSMVKAYEDECNNKKVYQPYSNNFEYYISDCESEIEFHKKRLSILKQKYSIISLIKAQGWDEFDVSDETIRDSGYRFSMNFIGTKKEFDILIKSLKEITV
jgi:hypothetical protein